MELYFAPLACSMSARIALAEAGAAINLVEVDTKAGRMVATGEDYRAVNPLGYVPALKLDDGTVLTENSAILQYIADQYPEAELAPPASDRVGRAKLRQWLSFISSELHKGLMTPLLGDNDAARGQGWTLNKYAPTPRLSRRQAEGPGIPARPLQRRRRLSRTVLNWTRATPQIDLSVYPNVKAYLERMRPRPSVSRLWRPRFRCSTRKSRGARRPSARYPYPRPIDPRETPAPPG